MRHQLNVHFYRVAIHQMAELAKCTEASEVTTLRTMVTSTIRWRGATMDTMAKGPQLLLRGAGANISSIDRVKINP